MILFFHFYDLAHTKRVWGSRQCAILNLPTHWISAKEEKKETLNHNMMATKRNPENGIGPSSLPTLKQGSPVFPQAPPSVMEDGLPLGRCDVGASWLSALWLRQFLSVRRTYLRVLCCQQSQKQKEWVPQTCKGDVGDTPDYPATAFLWTSLHIRISWRVFLKHINSWVHSDAESGPENFYFHSVPGDADYCWFGTCTLRSNILQ